MLGRADWECSLPLNHLLRWESLTQSLSHSGQFVKVDSLLVCPINELGAVSDGVDFLENSGWQEFEVTHLEGFEHLVQHVVESGEGFFFGSVGHVFILHEGMALHNSGLDSFKNIEFSRLLKNHS